MRKQPFKNFPLRPTLPYDESIDAYRVPRKSFEELVKQAKFLEFYKQLLQECKSYKIPVESYTILLSTGVLLSELRIWEDCNEFLEAILWLHEDKPTNHIY